MKLLPKFALLSIGVAAMPLAIAGYSSSRISQNALRRSIEEHELMVAHQGAEYVTSHLHNLQNTLALEKRILDLSTPKNDAPGAELLRHFLRLVYLQHGDFSVVGLLDERGEPVSEPAYQSAPSPNTAHGDHEAMRPEDVALLERLTPLAAALADGASIGPVFLAGVAQIPHMILAVRFDPVKNEPTRIIAAAVSLRRIANYLATLSTADTNIVLIDKRGRRVASGWTLDAYKLEIKRLPKTPMGTLPRKELVAEYDSEGGKVIGAYAPAAPYGLGVLVERPLEIALSPVRSARWATVYWMSVSGAIAAAVAAVLARRLSRRVGALAGGARRIAQGKLDTQLEVQSNDELGDVAKAFNAMATSLDAARTEILRQTEEIVAWNETLERRVEEKTKELREAQDLLLRSRSLSAIGALGAGVAHEINNPLTGVLGLAQLLLSDLPDDHPARPMIQDIEDQALRIQGIVSNLLRLAQKQSGEDFRPLDLSRVIDDALELCGLRMEAPDAAFKVVKRVTSPSPLIRGNSAQLQAALIQLIQNARGAGDGAGILTLETSIPEDKLLRLRVSDSGRGIRPEHLPRIFDPFFTTKVRRTDAGIGLSVVHKIVEDHGGTIRVDSELGQGTTFWITFPIDPGSGHLA